MNFIFLMDSLEKINFQKDTTFMLMAGAARRGHSVFFLPQGGISLLSGKIFFKVREVVPQLEPERGFQDLGMRKLGGHEADVVFIRTDPPFNEAYLMDTWLLDQLPEEVLVINAPSGIRGANEKLWASKFHSLVPKTLVSRDLEELLNFFEETKDVIAKPTDRFGGSSVFHLRKGTDNVRVTLETLTKDGSKEIILQKYLPEAEYGDKRILLLNGDPIGAVLRVHPEEDHRNNFFAGGRAEQARITSLDDKIIQVLKPHLKECGLLFAGIDVIGGKLIEVNVTSPTCLQEINQLDGKNLEDQVIAFAEEKVKSL